jgi:hypothetical protein
MQELSPTNPLKANSASTSFIKPASPKPSEIKTHHRTVTQSSAYNRIVSNTSIKKLSLPSFLRSSSASKEDLLNKIPLGKMTPVQTSDIATDSSSIRTEEVKQTRTARDPNEFFRSVFRKKQNKDEILLKVGKFELARGDLQTLEPKTFISRNVIDACLRCIKHKNRKFFKSTEVHDRVMIIDTLFSQAVFTEDCKKWPVLDRNPLKYE